MGEALLAHGFRAEDRPGVVRRGWYRPSTPQIGIEVVGAALMDGLAETSRCQEVVVLPPLPSPPPLVIPAEDLIADWVAQWRSGAAGRALLDQAIAIAAAVPHLDHVYLRCRLAAECPGEDPDALLREVLPSPTSNRR